MHGRPLFSKNLVSKQGKLSSLSLYVHGPLRFRAGCRRAGVGSNSTLLSRIEAGLFEFRRLVFLRTLMSVTPEAIRDLLDELEASRASRKRAWENLQEIRWILKDARKTIDLEGRVVKDGVRKIVNDRQVALQNLVHAINSSGSSPISQ